MNTLTRLVEMILRGQNDKFKSVLQEELRERAAVLMEKVYQTEAKRALEMCETKEPKYPEENTISTKQSDKPTFIPESSYRLKDGNVGILTTEEKQLVIKLHESLNIDNQERMVKLLSESVESFNKVLKLAKMHNKK